MDAPLLFLRACLFYCLVRYLGSSLCRPFRTLSTWLSFAWVSCTPQISVRLHISRTSVPGSICSVFTRRAGTCGTGLIGSVPSGTLYPYLEE